MEQLQGAVTKAEASLKDRVTDHETSVNLLNSQLHEALAERDTAKTELRKHEEAVQSTSNTQQEHLYAQIQVCENNRAKLFCSFSKVICICNHVLHDPSDIQSGQGNQVDVVPTVLPVNKRKR